MATVPSPTPGRGAWGSKLGFILAASGSAIGLGNIWRFPYSAGEGGGGAFVLVYLLFVALIGVPVMLAELSVGRTTQKSPVGAFKALFPDSVWPWVGALGVITGFGILAFYSVIAGWTVAYLGAAFTGGIAGLTDSEASGAYFTQLIGNGWEAAGLAALFLLVTALVVRGGISGGIERATKILMPILLVILVLLAVRAMTLPGAGAGISYLFKPDFGAMTITDVMGALGQALFSLSLGMGAMITYGSYMPKDQDLPSSGIIVAIFDTAIAILAGLIIFPALFAVGGDPSGGPGLVFVVLPTIFESLPAGGLFAIAFYLLLSIAALTSTISLLEVVVSYFVDEKEWSREKATWVVTGACLLLAVPSALSFGASEFLSTAIPLGDGSFLDFQNILWGNFSLSIGALLICLFVGWKWGTKAAAASLEENGDQIPAQALWEFLVKYVCPIAVGAILVYVIVTGNFF